MVSTVDLVSILGTVVGSKICAYVLTVIVVVIVTAAWRTGLPEGNMAGLDWLPACLHTCLHLYLPSGYFSNKLKDNPIQSQTSNFQTSCISVPNTQTKANTQTSRIPDQSFT